VERNLQIHSAMRKQTDNLFESSPACTTLYPPKGGREGAKASPGLSRRHSSGSSLRSRAPELFAELVRQYGNLLDGAVEQRMHENTTYPEVVDTFITRLERLRAGARDIIELHARALDDKLATAPQRLTGVYLEEGRFVVLELMGRLLSTYRTAFLQATQPSGNGS
jgi:hypothetical protein